MPNRWAKLDWSVILLLLIFMYSPQYWPSYSSLGELLMFAQIKSYRVVQSYLVCTVLYSLLFLQDDPGPRSPLAQVIVVKYIMIKEVSTLPRFTDICLGANTFHVSSGLSNFCQLFLKMIFLFFWIDLFSSMSGKS